MCKFLIVVLLAVLLFLCLFMGYVFATTDNNWIRLLSGFGSLIFGALFSSTIGSILDNILTR